MRRAFLEIGVFLLALVAWAALCLHSFDAPVSAAEKSDKERIAALEKELSDLKRTVVYGEEMWQETSPGHFDCRIAGGGVVAIRREGQSVRYRELVGGCHSNWQAPISETMPPARPWDVVTPRVR